MSAAQSRSRATVSLPLKVKGSTGYFVIDMKGEFKNIPLFDATVGLKRILSKWLKPHHSLSCVVIVASRVINNSILLHHKSFLIRFFLCKCFRDRLHLSTDFSIPMTMLSPLYEFTPLLWISSTVTSLSLLKSTNNHNTICVRLVAGVMVIGGK